MDAFVDSLSEDEAIMLAEWFRTVADNESCVVGWW